MMLYSIYFKQCTVEQIKFSQGILHMHLDREDNVVPQCSLGGNRPYSAGRSHTNLQQREGIVLPAWKGDQRRAYMKTFLCIYGGTFQALSRVKKGYSRPLSWTELVVPAVGVLLLHLDAVFAHAEGQVHVRVVGLPFLKAGAWQRITHSEVSKEQPCFVMDLF